MTSYFQGGGHDVRPSLVTPYAAASACNVIGPLYALQFLIHRTLVLVISEID